MATNAAIAVFSLVFAVLFGFASQALLEVYGFMKDLGGLSRWIGRLFKRLLDAIIQERDEQEDVTHNKMKRVMGATGEVSINLSMSF